MLDSIFKAKLDNISFPHLTCKYVYLNKNRIILIKPSFINEIGWEVYMDYEDADYLNYLILNQHNKFNIIYKGYNFIDKLTQMVMNYKR